MSMDHVRDRTIDKLTSSFMKNKRCHRCSSVLTYINLNDKMSTAKKVKELKAGVPFKSKQQSGSKTTSLRITGPSDKDKKSAQSSTTVAPVPIRVPYSSATSKGRKGNLNGSRSSLPLHEHRLRNTALRRSTNVSPSVEQLKNNSSTLEEQMAVKTAPREATSVSPLIEQLKNNSSTLEKQMAVIRSELQSIINAKSKSVGCR
ncbi:unnamed protein product [Angiostrongylus costaricensis]|uniref:CEP170_C domain-containing protein n=1 Tax=Angiostrongylus costaricensis TaxID=334426 RepID=A0A0R3PHP9_ANGCS|nr:unnamed protein product [Angiostrongylus costaricensis]